MSGRTTAQRVVVLGAALAVSAAAGGGLPPLASVQAAAPEGILLAPVATEPTPLEHWDVERTTATPAELASAALSQAPGQVAPAAFGTAANGVPERVLQAYLGAERLLSEQDPTCRLPWWLVAGIGAVESRHASGGRVDVDGRTRGLVLGPVLDGSLAGTAVITDSDGGALDGNAAFDRAVGPMQFLPGTWAAWGADADGDGTADPHDIDDAAFSAGRYLCAGGGDLTRPEDLASAVLRYNRSTEYLEAVLGWGAAYRDGGVPVPGESGEVEPAPTTAPAPPAAPAPTLLVRRPAASPQPATTTAPPPSPSPTGSPTTPAPGTGSPTVPTTGAPDVCTPTGDPTDAPTGDPTGGPTNPTDGSATTDPTGNPTGGPTDGPTDGGTQDPGTQQPTQEPGTAAPGDGTVPDPGCGATPTPSEPTSSGEPTALSAATTRTADPSDDPTSDPTDEATDDPTSDPTDEPTDDPTGDPTSDPTDDPTASQRATRATADPTDGATRTR